MKTRGEEHKLLQALAVIFIILVTWLPRGLALNQYVTPDEPKWLTRAANFYLALAQGDFANTYQVEHPGVTIMWAGAAGFYWRYPDYVTAGPRQQSRPQRFKRYLDNHGHPPLQLLEAGRVLIVLGTTIFLALAFVSAIRLIGIVPALLGFLLLAFDPFHIAHSRLLHPDSLLSTLMLLALITMMNYLYRGRRWFDLLLAGVSGGLSWLTKSPALFLIPFFGVLVLVEFLRTWKKAKKFQFSNLWYTARPFGIWLGLALLTFFIFWPAMWVAPLDSLSQILNGATIYAAEGHSSPLFFNGTIYPGAIPDWRFYLVNYFWRSTPITLTGLLLSVPAIFLRPTSFRERSQRQAMLGLAVFALAFTLFMTAGAKKFDRYLLPVFGPLDLLAGLGWWAGINWFWKFAHSKLPSGRWGDIFSNSGAAVFVSVVIVIQLMGAMKTSPYYLNYYNPLAGGSARAPEVMLIGWGEGLDIAARYLNAKPGSQKLRVKSWYSDGPFSYIFQGISIVPDFPSDPRDLLRVDYIVIYRHQWQRQLPSEEFLAFFDTLLTRSIPSTW